MTLIICEKYRIARAVARSLKATTRLHFGVFTNKEITVAFVRKNFITLTPLSEMAGGRVPFIPAKYKMQVTDKSTDRRLRRLFRTAKEVVFASGEGAEAQARFFNLCRHFRVGQPTSRMWLTQLDHEAIKPIFAKREKGRVLHNLAQCGLVANGMEMLFGYNFSRVLDRWYYEGKSLTRQEAVAISFLGRIDKEHERTVNHRPQHYITIDAAGLNLASDQTWETADECAAILEAIKTGTTVKASMTVSETTDPKLSPHIMTTLQMDAFDNLGWMPTQTIAVATRLYERGIITSPYTDNPQRGIMPLQPLPHRASGNERAMYDMIAHRMEATTIQPATRQYATYKVEIAGMTFSRKWEINEPQPEYAGTTELECVIEAKAVVPYTHGRLYPLNFSTFLYNLRRLANVNPCMHAGMPYNRYDHEWGTVIEGLEQKGFIAIDGDGNIHLTSEGKRLTIDLEPYDLMFELGGDRFNPGAILLGHTTGRKLISAFEQWITETVGDILKYVPKEDNQAAAVQESDTFPALPEK